jgi:beta propeller repeat protein
MKSKIILTVLALIYLIGLISVSSAAQITKIGTGHDPAIYGSKITWSDTAGSIHLYDLVAKKDTKISSSKASYPAIYGNKLVWHDESNGTSRLTVYDIPSGARSYITRDVDSDSIPAIYGNRVVWDSNDNVYMRDISKSTQTNIAAGTNPDIYDTKIAYTYDSGDRPQVYVYDIITKKTTKVSSGGDLYNPHIYGNKVIWSDFNTRMGYISMSNLATNKIIDITSDNTNSGDPNNPDCGCDTGFHNDIFGDKIVYSKITNDCMGKAGVYVYNIGTAQRTRIFNTGNSVYTTPNIYNNIVVWAMEEGAASHDIYVYNLTAAIAKPMAAFTANKVSGTHPFKVTFTYTGKGSTPDSYLWNFGDKTTSTHALTVTHTYTKAGTYTVSVTVKNSAGSSTSTKTKYITVK